MANPADPQSLNRYSYVNNNPVRYTDPSGHMLDTGANEGGGGCNSILCFPQSPTNPSDGGGEDDDDEDEPGHDYTVENPVCLNLSWINCTEEEVANYMTHFQYPGQWPRSPVVDGHYYEVWPAEFWGIPNPALCYIGMCDSGTIRVEFGDNPLTIANVTTSTHIFNVGDVVRRSDLGADGTWHLTTHGEGTNDGFGIIPGPALDTVNQNIGPIVFNAVDLQLVAYTTIVETLQYASTFIP